MSAKFFILFLFVSFLFSCEDPNSVLGFKDKPRFEVKYVEIPLTSQTIVLDSIRTQNLASTDTRVLAGQYIDPVFGKMYAEAFSQIYPSNFTTTVSASAVLDEAFLSINTDYFLYGGTEIATQTFTLHEVTETLKLEKQGYYSKSPTTYNSTPIGEASISVNPVTFKEELDDTNDDPVLSLKFNLDASYAERLFRIINKDDKAFTEFTQFREAFKGLAIVPQSSSNKIIGLNLAGTSATITLNYHDGDQKLSFTYLLNAGVSYTRIIADRSGTAFAEATEFSIPYETSGKRGVQSGSGVTTKLNLKNFFDFADQVPNAVFNSVQLVINNVEAPGIYYAPSLGMAKLTDENKLFRIRVENKADSTSDANSVALFRGLLGNQGTAYVAVTDNFRDPLSMSYNSTSGAIEGFCTSFFQELFYLRKNNKTFENFALYPLNPSISKSVYRVSFPSDAIKLRIYYTSPLNE